MVSVMSNNDLDLDRNPKGVEENDVVFDSSNEQIRVWHGDDVNSSGGVTGSNDIRVCKTEGVRKDRKVDVLDGNVDSDNVGVEEVRGSDVDMKGIDEKIKKSKQFSDENGGSERLESCVGSGQDTESSSGGKGKIDKLGSGAGRGHLEVEKSSVSQYDSMLSMFDEFAANGRDESLEKPPGYGIRSLLLEMARFFRRRDFDVFPHIYMGSAVLGGCCGYIIGEWSGKSRMRELKRHERMLPNLSKGLCGDNTQEA